MDVLFVCATWHGLAKLRLHTDATLELLDEITVSLGETLRHFVKTTCSKFNTRELPREAAARSRQAASAQKGKKRKSVGTPAAATAHMATSTAAATTRRPKTLNLNTYKFHSLGDVPATIRRYGTTDSYSTELAKHRTVKARYQRTNRKEYRRQIARIERREARLRRIHMRTSPLARADDETVRQANPEIHHVIGRTENLPLHIGAFVTDHTGDPAVFAFIPKLKRHLLPRIKAMLSRSIPEPTTDSAAALTSDLWQKVHLKHDRIYKHNLFRVNYTTYDVRRGEDIIHVNTSHRNIMVLNPLFTPDNGEHPYWYARVLGIYHANVFYLGEGNTDYNPQRVEFLWVRWFSCMDGVPSGWKHRRLDRLKFPFLNDEDAFGFLDPSDVVRGCHVIPRFFTGKARDDIRGLSKLANDVSDYGSYYINR
ncbi:hypothetical protein DXG01_011578, partial [Tephrocybe rancida]